jgi:hypothetical protein
LLIDGSFEIVIVVDLVGRFLIIRKRLGKLEFALCALNHSIALPDVENDPGRASWTIRACLFMVHEDNRFSKRWRPLIGQGPDPELTDFDKSDDDSCLPLRLISREKINVKILKEENGEET